MLAANTRFLAFATWCQSGCSESQWQGNIGQAAPLFEGHKASVVDVAFNPFNDYVVASASDDAPIQLWRIAEQGDKVIENKSRVHELQ
jgi:WD40 repeat protein